MCFKIEEFGAELEDICNNNDDNKKGEGRNYDYARSEIN